MPADRSTLAQDERTKPSGADLGGMVGGVAGWSPLRSQILPVYFSTKSRISDENDFVRRKPSVSAADGYKEYPSVSQADVDDLTGM